MINNKPIIDNNLLIEFIKTCSIRDKFITLERALRNEDIIIF